ncbi:hypothetical protein [Methylobacterium sp. CM6257]
MALVGPNPLSRKAKSRLRDPAPLNPADRADSLFQTVMFALIALDLAIRFGADIWHRLWPTG